MPLKERRRASIPVTTYLFFLALFGGVVIFSHLPFWKLPFFWDEAGQFVPNALDLYHSGSWIPYTTDASVHPPGIAAYLALVWHLFGYSIPAARLAMLALASLALLVVFQLAIHLCREVRGAPAFLAMVLMLACPLFYTQSMMVQLDMPAMLFGTLALLMFLQNRVRWCAAACVALVLMKETGVVFPLVFGGWLAAQKRWRDAVWFVAPGLALTAWVSYLGLRTGHPFGPTSFTQYNAVYPLHPVRVAAAFLRRIYYLGVADFRWIGLIALVHAWRRTSIFRTRGWRVAGTVAAANIILFSVTGGAVLDRYLLPALPIVLAAMAAAFMTLPSRLRIAAPAVLVCGMFAGLFWNPPYPFPYEDNLAFTDFVRLHEEAAGLLAHYADARITTAWPLSDELIRPALGYVPSKLHVRLVQDLSARRIAAQQWLPGDVLVLFSRQWEPSMSLLHWAPVRWFCARYYGYEPDLLPEELSKQPGWRSMVRWTRGGQWVEVYTRVEDGV